jgi:hypothetical protein
LIASLAKLARRGSRFQAAAFLTLSLTKSMSARSLVQYSGARSDLIASLAKLARPGIQLCAMSSAW